jgi:hypothetical protein
MHRTCHNRADVLNEFKQVKTPNNPTRYKCICGDILCRNVKTTLLPHYRNCTKIENKKIFDNRGYLLNCDHVNNNNNSNNNNDDTIEQSSLRQTETCKKRKLNDKSSQVTSQPLSKREKDICDKVLNLWLCTNDGISFNALEDPLFIYFCKLLNPSYTPPNRQHHATTLLPQHKNEIKFLVEQELKKAGSAVLSLDGSEDNCRDPITHICAHIPHPLLIDIVRNDEQKQGSELLCENLLKGKEYLDKILFTHDNENKMKKVGKLWQQKTGKGHYGCGPHA